VGFVPEQCPAATLKSLGWGKALAKCEAAAKFLGNAIAAKATRREGGLVLYPCPGCLAGWPWWAARSTLTGSQNVQSWQGPLWVIYPNPLPKQGHLQQAAQDCVQVGLEYLHRRRLCNLPGQPVTGLRHPQSEEVLPHVHLELPLLQFVPVAPCPVTGHH